MNDLFGQASAAALIGLVAANVFADQMGLPLPATPALILAGTAAAGRYAELGLLFLGSVAACLIADCAWYWAGRRFGGRVMRLICRMSLNPDSCVSDSQRRFEGWGGGALLVAKFVPGLSAIAAPLAGALNMRLRRFLYLSTLGSALWVAAFLLAGMLLVRQIHALQPRLVGYGREALLIAGAVLLGYLVIKWLRRWRFRSMLRMARISVQDLYRLLQSGSAPVVIDVRTRGGWTLDPRSIPGALHVPAADITAHVTPLPRDRDIVLYCNCPNEASAARVAQVLQRLGFARVQPLLGGLDAWVRAGYPVHQVVPPAMEPAAGQGQQVSAVTAPP